MPFEQETKGEENQERQSEGGTGGAAPLLGALGGSLGRGVLQRKIARRAIQRKTGGTSSTVIQRKGGESKTPGSDRFAQARDLVDPNRTEDGTSLGDRNPLINFYAELLKLCSADDIRAVRTDNPGVFDGT